MFSGSKNLKEPCTRAVQAFYDEVKLYEFDKPGFSTSTGHFTQVSLLKSHSYNNAVSDHSV